LIAQIDAGIQQIVPGAQAQFKAALAGLYQAYQYTLDYAYGTVATVVQEIAMINTLEVNADSLNGFGKAADTLMNYIFEEVVAGSEQNFKYAMGLADEPYVFEMDEDLLDDPAITAIAVLAARFELGNSFYAHPNEAGHDEITDAVMNALENDVFGDAFTKRKLTQYVELLEWIISQCNDETYAYVITDDSYYVAIDELYGSKKDKNDISYADKLAAELGIAYTEIDELDADEIAKADLITVRYNNEPMINYMVDQTTKAMADKALDDYDWSVYVGENGAAYVQQAMTKVEAMLGEQGLSQYADVATVAVESYAYEYVGHLITYIEELKAITDISPEALVISVGMNNALSDVVLTLGEEEVALGKYIQYVVDAANLEAFVYALIASNVGYVDAAEVETNFTLTNASLMSFITNVTMFPEDLKATDEGHAYIKEQIYNALTVTVYDPSEDGPSEENPPEENVTMLGDADLDGDVDARDAALAYGIFNAKVNNATEQQLKNADVDGDGDVDARDAALIYAYFNGKMAAFPAE